MRKWIIWSFERGSFQYDVLCGLILIVIFIIPPGAFNDRPDYLRIPPSGEFRRALDEDGLTVYTVRAEGYGAVEAEQIARARLAVLLESPEPLRVRRSLAVYDTRGMLAAYSFWLHETP